ncbi:uncharacterized protein ColSpa_04474 [Colletotrichum spaethianum]|uniref:Transmembrane protein n=1 Tax=Colletotrichum spaethianum TaxID=700344 RepID=A0AA37L9G5_9PEZI|nr:uncharacterized protein ColSpa_04474 [Colletotrichum spaethianum]GKT44293.1 hypothetical protein ColSpa_04474 [Colletotrichum spaethianum]
MQNFRPVRPDEARRSEVSSLGSFSTRDSTAYELEPQGHYLNNSSSDEPQEVHVPDDARVECHAKTHLLQTAEFVPSDNDENSRRSQWRALGTLGLCIMVFGTLLIAAAVILLGCFWQMSMRARDGEIVHSQIWNRVIFSDWASRFVTITAAVLRVSLALQMGVFTAMIASLMIERAGVPISSAPLMSMLRAVSASPYNLITWTTFSMPWRNRLIYTVAIVVSVLLVAGFQFASTALLSDFAAVNVTAPQTTADVSLYGDSDISGYDPLQGSKLWNSQPWTYFRFAEHPRTPRSEQLSDRYEDTGSILRALPPFEAETSRSRLRRYQGPAAVLDSRVVCVRPNITDVDVSLEGYSSGGGSGQPSFEEFFARGSFGFLDDFDGLIVKPPSSFDRWAFSCVVPGGDTQNKTWDISICSPSSYSSGSLYQGLPVLSNSSFGATQSRLGTDIFLMFKSTGSAESWRQILQQFGKVTITDYASNSAVWEADAANWTTSTDGIWARVHLPETNYSMSVSACFTTLGATFLNVSMSSESNEPEPSLSWDNATAQFNVDVIRNRYSTPGNGTLSSDSRGILTLDSWESEHDAERVKLSASSTRLPSMSKFKYEVNLLPCGTLKAGPTGGDSSRALHYAHSTLFQDVMKTTGSLAEALQAVLTVTRQMEYYEYVPQFRRQWSSPASYIMAEEKVMPVQWLGFSIVVGMVGIHFFLLLCTTTLFLTLTQASWIGNVWMSISQAVSAETEDIIQKSTRKDDEEVEKMIREASNKSDSGLRNRVKVQRNKTNKRHEIISF